MNTVEWERYLFILILSSNEKCKLCWKNHTLWTTDYRREDRKKVGELRGDIGAIG